MSGAVDKAYAFEGYTLDLKRGFLLHDGRQIELRPKSFAVLHFLIENAGRLVSKDEIVEAIWPNLAVTDESLARCISDVRLALADGQQRIIKTVPRRGYLFAAPLSERSVSAASLGPLPLSAGPRGTEGGEARRSAERRQLTVMFCEVVGLAALSTRLDPEDLRAVTVACHRHCALMVQKHHGYVARYSRNGLLVYFGYPDADEDDAEHAVRAGLALVESRAPLAAAHGGELQLRIGIASGLVVIGSEIGTDNTMERVAVGETPTLANVLQSAAEPGTVVISQVTRRLLGRLFEYRDQGWLGLNELAQPVRAWRVLGASGIESRFEALRSGAMPLIGRDEEIDLLMRRWEQAKFGHGSLVMISGEPGIGKSRLLQALQERIAAEPHIRLRYFCSPHHQDSMLYPAIAQLERAAGFRREDGPEQRLAKLEVVLAQATNELTEAVPLLADLMSIPIATDRYPPLSLTAQKRKEKTIGALLAQLEGLAARQPVLMLFEGVHWSDPTTRESLDLFIEQLPARRILLVLTFRPEFAPPWIGRPHATLLSLSRLAPQQGKEMIAGITGGNLLSEAITQQIVERADGVPLFIEELTKAVIESGKFSDAGEPMGPPLAIPTTLHSSLLARLDRLGKARDLAQIAAALGRHFSHELISAVAAAPQAQTNDALVQLVRAELIFCRGTPPEAHYTFKHALVRDVAYTCLLRDQRREIHARIAATLENQFHELSAAQPQLVAHHYAEAGLNEKAVSYWLKVGRQALAHSKMSEATAQLQKGLDLLGTLPDTPERCRQELELQVTRCQALIALQGYAAPLVGQTLARARQICEQIDASPQLAYVLWAQVLHDVVKGDIEPALAHAEAMEQFGEAHRDLQVLATGVRLAGNVSFWRGDFVAAHARFERTLALFDASHRPLYAKLTGLDDHYVSALIYSFRTLSARGYLDQARARCDIALTAARQLSHPYPLVNALCHASYGDWGLQPIDVLLERAEEAGALCEQHGFLLWLAATRVTRGWCVAALGRVDDGIALLIDGISIARRLSSPLQVPFALTLLADAYRRAKQPQEALKRLAEALDTIQTTQARWPEAEVYRIRAELLLAVQRTDAAEASLKTALAVARRQSAKLWELRAANGLARLWRDQRKRTEARDLLAPIYGWFTEGIDTPDLNEAKTLLDELA